MGKIKGWKKDNRQEFSDFWSYGRESYITIMDKPYFDNNNYYVKIVTGFQTYNQKEKKYKFNTKKEAITFAINYMRSHPNG